MWNYYIKFNEKKPSSFAAAKQLAEYHWYTKMDTKIEKTWTWILMLYKNWQYFTTVCDEQFCIDEWFILLTK